MRIPPSKDFWRKWHEEFSSLMCLSDEVERTLDPLNFLCLSSFPPLFFSLYKYSFIKSKVIFVNERFLGRGGLRLDRHKAQSGQVFFVLFDEAETQLLVPLFLLLLKLGWSMGRRVGLCTFTGIGALQRVAWSMSWGLKLFILSERCQELVWSLTRARANCFPMSCEPLLGTFEASVWSRVAAAWIRQLKYVDKNLITFFTINKKKMHLETQF